MHEIAFPPRVMRPKYASYYLGVDKNRFNTEIRPHLRVIAIGKQGIAFDKVDLDKYVDENMKGVGKPGSQLKEEENLWQRSQQVSRKEKVAISGASTKSSREKDFTKALEQVASKTRSAI